MSDESKTQAGDFLGDLLRSAQERPVSAGLVAMGIVWMFSGGSKVSVSETFSQRPFKKLANTVAEGAGTVGSGVGSALSSTAGGIADAATSITKGVGQIADDAASSLAGAARSSLDGVQAAGEGLGRVARDAAENANATSTSAFASTQRVGSRAGSQLQQQVGDILDRQPSLIGIVGLAIGAGIAAALPITSSENELMGKHSDAVREQAKSVISDKTQAITDVASRVAGL